MPSQKQRQWRCSPIREQPGGTNCFWCRHDQRDGAVFSPVCDTLYTGMTGAMCAAENLAVSSTPCPMTAQSQAQRARWIAHSERIERAATPALLYGEVCRSRCRHHR